jgi:hypothetical protein
MIVNNKFKYFRKTVNNRNRSIIANNGITALFKHWNNSSVFPQGWKSPTNYTEIKNMLTKE